MNTKTKFIFFIIALFALSIFTVLYFTSSQKAEVGKFYITKQYPNAFELEDKPFYDTVQVLEIRGKSIKYVGWIGWEFVDHEKEFFTVFEPCQSCENKANLKIKIRYEDRRK